MTQRDSYRGIALFSYGFRPFFLAAILCAMIIVPIWWCVWQGELTLRSPFAPVDWHIHEMVFGYGAAVVAGFLFTAVPNWTGRLPARGWPLAMLLLVWGAGRGAVAGWFGASPVLVACIDQAFLLAVAAMITREIVAGRNWRNLKVLIPVCLLWASNILFHVEASHAGANYGRRLAIALLVFLVFLIGGRIIPSFTRNWLSQRGARSLPVAFNRFDGTCILAGVVALAVWVIAPESHANIVTGAVAAGLHLFRLIRWRGAATWRSPLLAMLHIAYLTIPVAFMVLAASALGVVDSQAVAHLFGIAVVGSMTVAVMMRAAMGHTGRPLVAGPSLVLSFALVSLAAIARAVGPVPILAGLDGIDISAAMWTLSFFILSLRIGPWLMRPKAGRRQPSQVQPDGSNA